MTPNSGSRVFWDGTTLSSPLAVSYDLPKISFEAHLTKSSQLIAFESPFMYGDSYEERLNVLRHRIPFQRSVLT